jgi:hypothetical protein
MHHLTSYLPPLVAFAAMFVGLLGPSRHSDKTGLRAITTFGWVSCAIAAISLAVAVYLQHKKDLDLQVAIQSQQQLRTVVTREMRQGVESLRDVLRYAALMPYMTTARTGSELPRDIPYNKYAMSHLAVDIDLRSKEVTDTLQQLYLSPGIRLKAPIIPSAMPFGTDIARPCMTVLTDESRAAATRIESAVQKYAVVALTPEVIAAGSELVTAPFLKHMMGLRQSWENRVVMEDSNSPRPLNFRFLDSGLSGGYTQQYLELVGRIDRLTVLLDAAQS